VSTAHPDMHGSIDNHATLLGQQMLQGSPKAEIKAPKNQQVENKIRLPHVPLTKAVVSPLLFYGSVHSKLQRCDSTTALKK